MAVNGLSVANGLRGGIFPNPPAKLNGVELLPPKENGAAFP